MILDKGICTVYRETDTSDPGDMPTKGRTQIYKSWYGVRNFETAPIWQTDGRKEQKCDMKVRVLQCLGIRQNDIAVLSGTGETYRIIRAYHGEDDDGPTPITDLSLEVITP